MSALDKIGMDVKNNRPIFIYLLSVIVYAGNQNSRYQ